MINETAVITAFIASLANWTPAAQDIEPRELRCMARNIYFEARSEPFAGQIAVANVTMNRVEDERWPDTVCEVVWQPKQFSWTHDGKSDRPKDEAAYMAAIEIAAFVMIDWVPDSTAGATHYYNPTLANPPWAAHLTMVGGRGSHLFMR